MKNIPSTRQHLLLIFATLFSLTSNAQKLTLVKDINASLTLNSYPKYLTVFKNKLYFVASSENGGNLYATDGTDAGTTVILDGPSDFLTVHADKLYFMHNDGQHGLELWVSDGTVSGTHMLKDLKSGYLGSRPTTFTSCNGLLFFQASGDLSSFGLWVTDGTEAGTILIKQGESTPFTGMDKFIAYNNKIYFHGGPGPDGLWESDGTVAGTKQVKKGNFGIDFGNETISNGKIYLMNGDDAYGDELWISDGTETGTVMLKDICTGKKGSNPDKFMSSDGKIYFVADDSIHGKELWTSDGTANGTVLVQDIVPGANGSSPQNIVEFKGEVYFFATGGTDWQLYKTSKSITGATFIKTLPGVHAVPYLYEFDHKLYFIGTDGNSDDGTLYTSDGTAAGTVQISPAIQLTTYQWLNFATFNNELYLPAYYGTQGVELCKLSFSTTGITTSSASKTIFQVVPNPVSGIVNLQFNLDEPSDFTIYVNDLSGRQVLKVADKLQFSKGANTYSFKLPSEIANGSYFLNVVSANEHTCVKIIKSDQ